MHVRDREVSRKFEGGVGVGNTEEGRGNMRDLAIRSKTTNRTSGTDTERRNKNMVDLEGSSDIMKDTSGGDLERDHTDIRYQRPTWKALVGVSVLTTKHVDRNVSDLERTVAELSSLFFSATPLPDIDMYYLFSMPSTTKSCLSRVSGKYEGVEDDLLYHASIFLSSSTRSSTRFQAKLEWLKRATERGFAFNAFFSNIKFGWKTFSTFNLKPKRPLNLWHRIKPETIMMNLRSTEWMMPHMAHPFMTHLCRNNLLTWHSKMVLATKIRQTVEVKDYLKTMTLNNMKCIMADLSSTIWISIFHK